MRLVDIQIERNNDGVFATVTNSIGDKLFTETIWSVTGLEASLYREITDEEIRDIAFQRWKLLKDTTKRKKSGED